MLSHEQRLTLLAGLERCVSSEERQLSSRQSLRDLYHLILDKVCSESTQYFASDYERQFYLFDLFELDSSMRRTLGDLQQSRGETTEWTHPRDGTDTLTDHDERERAWASTTALALRQLIYLISSDESEQVAVTPTVRESDSTARRAVSDDVMRLTVVRVGTEVENQTSRRCVIQCRSVHHDDIELTLWDDYVDVARLCWEGATLHVVHPRVRSAHEVSTSSQSFVVLEPDILVDVTDIAECFQGNNVEPRLHFIRRWQSSRASQAMAVGSIINYCFDELLMHPEREFEQIFQEALLSKPLTMLVGVGSSNVDVVRRQVHDQLERIQPVLEEFRSARMTTEPSFFSPIVGLQGRLDLMLEYANDPRRKTIVELKSGSAPTIREDSTDAARNSGASTWSNHQAQISGYNLLLDTAFPGRHGDSMILYSKAAQFPLRNVANTMSRKKQVIACRNSIIAYEHQLLERNFRIMNVLGAESLAVPSFMQEEQRALSELFASLDTTERRVLQAFLSFLVREQYTQRVGSEGGTPGFAALWRDDLQQKSERMTLLSHLRLNTPARHFHSGIVELAFTDLTPLSSVFRVGDIAILYPMRNARDGAPYRGQVLKCSVRAVESRSVTVRLRNNQLDTSVFDAEEEWVLEQDYIESSLNSIYASFMSFFRADTEKRKRILGLRAPRTSEREQLVDPRLTGHQCVVLNSALRARDYFLIQGPPGTGKTSVMLRSLVREILADPTQTLLLAAFTNRAVDEICRAVYDLVEPHEVLRMGSKENTEYVDVLFQTRVASQDLSVAETVLAQARVVVSTVSFLHSNAELFRLKTFRTAIVDEAAQILEPHIVGILARVEKFILIGDEKQLPAIVSQPESWCTIKHESLQSIGLENLGISLFETLLNICKRNGWTDAFAMLDQQARMHEDIQHVASTMFYESRLQSLSPWQTESQYSLSQIASLDDEATNVKDSDSLLWNDVYTARLMFISTPTQEQQKINTVEALVCVELAERLLARSDERLTLGIITPFRAQIREISMRLPDDLRSRITVDTVERFQGSERDIIILSTCANANSIIPAMQSLSTINGQIIDRKLNVALTRARHRFIILGNENVLRSSEHYAHLIDLIAMRGVVKNVEEYDRSHGLV